MRVKTGRAPHDDPDVRLMLRFQAGDQEAFRDLYAKYVRSVVNYAQRFLGSQARAEELAQDVFLQVYRWQQRYVATAKFSTWLFRIAHNQCLNEVRKGEYRLTLEPLDPVAEAEEAESPRGWPDPTASPGEDLLAAKEAADRIRRILLDIPENQRAALLLSRVEGLSYQEVAGVLECSEKAVKSLVFRATQSLRSGLRDLIDDHEV